MLGPCLCQEIQMDGTGPGSPTYVQLGPSDVKARDALFQIRFPTYRIPRGNDSNKARGVGGRCQPRCSFLCTEHGVTVTSESRDETLAGAGPRAESELQPGSLRCQNLCSSRHAPLPKLRRAEGCVFTALCSVCDQIDVLTRQCAGGTLRGLLAVGGLVGF